MSAYYPPVDDHENVIKAALRAIQATHYSRAEDPHADAEHEYSDEQLALAARALAEAVDRLPEDKQPIGWSRAGDAGKGTASSGETTQPAPDYRAAVAEALRLLESAPEAFSPTPSTNIAAAAGVLRQAHEPGGSA